MRSERISAQPLQTSQSSHQDPAASLATGFLRGYEKGQALHERNLRIGEMERIGEERAWTNDNLPDIFDRVTNKDIPYNEALAEAYKGGGETAVAALDRLQSSGVNAQIGEATLVESELRRRGLEREMQAQDAIDKQLMPLFMQAMKDPLNYQKYKRAGTDIAGEVGWEAFEKWMEMSEKARLASAGDIDRAKLFTSELAAIVDPVDRANFVALEAQSGDPATMILLNSTGWNDQISQAAQAYRNGTRGGAAQPFIDWYNENIADAPLVKHLSEITRRQMFNQIASGKNKGKWTRTRETDEEGNVTIKDEFVRDEATVQEFNAGAQTKPRTPGENGLHLDFGQGSSGSPALDFGQGSSGAPATGSGGRLNPDGTGPASGGQPSGNQPSGNQQTPARAPNIINDSRFANQTRRNISQPTPVVLPTGKQARAAAAQMNRQGTGLFYEAKKVSGGWEVMMINPNNINGRSAIGKIMQKLFGEKNTPQGPQELANQPQANQAGQGGFPIPRGSSTANPVPNRNQTQRPRSIGETSQGSPAPQSIFTEQTPFAAPVNRNAVQGRTLHGGIDHDQVDPMAPMPYLRLGGPVNPGPPTDSPIPLTALPQQHYKFARNIMKEEGFREDRYEDTEGVATQGIGFNLQQPATASIAAYAQDPNKKMGIGQARDILYEHLNNLIPEVQRRYGQGWDQLSENQEVALIDMAYQMGVDGLFGFKKTISLLQQGQYYEAAVESLNSDWSDQTQERAIRNAVKLSNGTLTERKARELLAERKNRYALNSP